MTRTVNTRAQLLSRGPKLGSRFTLNWVREAWMHICVRTELVRDGKQSVKHVPRPGSNALTDIVWAVSQTCIWYFPPNKHSNTLQVKKKGKKKKHSHLNFNNVSYLNDWKWNYLAPAVFHCTPLLYFCKAICPLLLSNRATYPGSHLQTARKNWKRCSVLAETGRRSLWVLNCLNMHIMSRLPCEARPSAKWIINTTDLMLVWKMKHLALRRLHFEGFRVPYGFTSTFSSVVCKLMDKGDQLKLSPVAEKRRKKYLAKFFSLKRSQQTLAPPCFILWRNYHCLSWSEAH